MDRVCFFLLLVFGLYSCTTHDNAGPDIAYIKIFVPGNAQRADAYNRGLGAYYFASFDLRQDSVRYLYPVWKISGEDISYLHKAYVGRLGNEHYRDSFFQLLRMLDCKPEGRVMQPGSEGSLYCGSSYEVEYKIGDRIKHYLVADEANDTAKRFYQFLKDLEHHPWRKHPVAEKAVQLDEELVALSKRKGEYDSLPIPYIFPECETGVDFTKLHGNWRKVGPDFRSTRTDDFMCYTYKDNGTLLIRRYKDNFFTKGISVSFKVDVSDREIRLVNKKGEQLTQVVGLLTDSCMHITERINGRSWETKLHRMRQKPEERRPR